MESRLPSTLEELLLPLLDEGEIARIDALTRACGVTREEMLDMLLRTGLSAYEANDAPPDSGWRPTQTAS